MTIQKLNIIRTISLHLACWIGVWFFFVYFFSYNSNNRVYVIWFSSFLMPVTITTSYYVVYQLIPKYLLTRKYLKLALYGYYTFVYSSCFIVLTIWGLFVSLTNLKVDNILPMSRNNIFVLVLVYLVVGLAGFLSILNHNFKTLSKNKELENKILEAELQIKEQELSYLKKQIHPHFLFNTLNTIYGFALKKSQHTPEIILKLSNILDYILYQINKPKVSLKEEVLHIKEYIDLEKIRFQETLKIEFSCTDIDENIQISPMLLIPFVENTFKHGNLVNGYLRINIDIIANHDQLDFNIRNSFLHHETENSRIGIGLENIKKRLDFLYNDNYFLESEIAENWFNIKLVIKNLNVAGNV